MTESVQIRSLENCSFNELHAAHLKAFKDYPFQWTKDALQRTIHRRGFSGSLSFGAFDANVLIAFTRNGIGEFNGLATAYDTGTGTAEEYRGKGLASQIFEYSIPHLKNAGIKQYILEVLEENEAAYKVYAKQGFVVSRKFDCFRINSKDWLFSSKQLSNEFTLKEINHSYYGQMEKMHDFVSSWQNNFAALIKEPSHFKMIGAFKDNELVGYGIIEPSSGDIPQLAVIKEQRGKGIGRSLMHELKALNKADIIKIINIPSDQENIISFIQACGIPKIVSQFEMVRAI